MTGINPSSATIPIDTNQQFTVEGEDLDCVEWSTNPAGDPATGEGPTFTTKWSQAGLNKQVTATCPETNASASVDVVKVDKIQYNDPQGGWTDVPATLYVAKGTTVSFRAVKDPAGASWPSGKPVWGGTSGASGAGETKNVTFNTISSSTNDYKTVTAECGNTVTANVVVFDFEGTLTPADNFNQRSQAKYGLEEEVQLAFTTNPAGISAAQAGDLEWTKFNGVGLVSNAGTDGTADYDAKHVAGAVTLRLTITSGPSAGKNWNYPRQVVAPTGTRMTRVNTNVWHVQYQASAGIALYYWLDPKDVSFKNLIFGEDACPSTNVSGFYLYCWPWNSYPNGTQHAGHTQNTFGAILGGNITTGCRVEKSDDAGTGNAILYAAGSLTWSIPTQYIDGTSTRHTFGSNQNHVATYQADGNATLAKGGRSGSAAVNDPPSGY